MLDTARIIANTIVMVCFVLFKINTLLRLFLVIDPAILNIVLLRRDYH
jgi:hypothetical protein